MSEAVAKVKKFWLNRRVAIEIILSIVITALVTAKAF